MKTNLIFIILLAVIAFTGCEKEEKTDPRDQYIGDWYGTETLVFTEIGVSETLDVMFTFKKGTANNEIIVVLNDGSGIQYTATVNNTIYTYEKFSVYDTQNGFPVYYELNGTGVISGTQISENGTMLGNIDGYQYTGTWFRSLQKYN